jgi:hypothetical protein
MKGGAKPSQGLRLNGEKKMQILRNFEDDEAGCYVVYAKKVRSILSLHFPLSLLMFLFHSFLASDEGRVLYCCQ